MILRGDDEQIYRFITEGVEEISRAAAVFGTHRFARIGLSPPPSVSVGVRLDSGLLDLDFDVAGLDREELTRVLASYRQSRRYHRLRSGQFLALEGTALSGLAQIADGLELSDKELQEGRASVPPYRAMYLDKILQESDGIQFRRDGRFKELAKNMKAVADSDFPVPQSLEPVLRNYQKTGHRWLKTMEQYGFGGIPGRPYGAWAKPLQIISLLLDAPAVGQRPPFPGGVSGLAGSQLGGGDPPLCPGADRAAHPGGCGTAGPGHPPLGGLRCGHHLLRSAQAGYRALQGPAVPIPYFGRGAVYQESEHPARPGGQGGAEQPAVRPHRHPH